MAQTIADIRDMEFALFEQLQAGDLTVCDKFAEFTPKMFRMVLAEARNFALKEILPTYAEGDREGARFENGHVRPPECYRRPFALAREGEWGAMTEDPELGGQGLPQLIATAAQEFLTGTNFAFASYSMLGHGTGKMIELYGTDQQKELFLKNLYTGHWCGTMLLTEPEAGSDVGALTTTAVPSDDGTYLLSGNKIFITAGEHDLAENIIHPVLARIEGAPAGSKGISIFIVPKIWVNEDGSLGEPNDIVCTGIEEKMGLHGSATCSMTLGGKGKCRGLLLGEVNKGMRIMFTMMNEARLGVGLQALAHGSAAYLYALDYARQRVQGRDISQALNHDAPPVEIIHHPDVRRMLLEMKAYVEGMRSLTYYVARCMDLAENSGDPEKRQLYDGLVGLLTPVLKTYNSNKGYDVCTTAIQVYGGAGYTCDYPVEQLSRDCKITSIYEGTDGIQAMDLLARKLGMDQGQIFLGLLREMKAVCDRAGKLEGLAPLASQTAEALDRLGVCARKLGETAMSDAFRTAFAHSVPFLTAMGDICMAWMLLDRAAVAAERLAEGAKKKDAAFYEGQVKSADYFIRNLLPVTLGKLAAVEAGGDAAVTISEEAFGGK